MFHGKLFAAVIAIGTASICCAQVIWMDSFSDAGNWPEKWDLNNTMKFTFGKRRNGMDSCVAVSGTIKNPEKLRWMQRDTAWHITSVRVPITKKAPKFAISYKVSGETAKGGQMVGDAAYYSRITWFDENGDKIGSRGIPMLFPMDGSLNEVRFAEVLPQDAAFFSVCIGIDSPNLFSGDEIRFSDVKFELLDADAKVGADLLDLAPPRVKIKDPGPTEDRYRPIVLSVEDPSGVDWETLDVKIDGRQATKEFVRRSDGLVLERPARPWSSGQHKIDVKIADMRGNIRSNRKTFLIGRDPETPIVRLRDDGVLLIGGEPFFPIGAYGVQPSPFDGYDIDRAMCSLKKAGFNTVHSYRVANRADYLSALRKYGMKTFVGTNGENRHTIDVRRHNPDIIAWYIGDDTSQHIKYWDFFNREDSVKSVDTTRITCQADTVSPSSPVDSYENYAAATDVFLPEIYPVMEKSRPTNNTCVAKVVFTMKRIAEDNRNKGGDRVHAIWPIIQNFCGWDAWHRYPDPDEEYAMTFASIIHGAKGITWYSYSGSWVPKKETYSGFGFTQTEQAWTVASNLSSRISSLVPVLLERDGVQPPDPVVVAGPRRDAFGNPSVTGLLKRHGGKMYYLSVNATDVKVEARLPVKGCGKVSVLFEGRSLDASADGSVVDVFEPFAVHIYTWHDE